MFIILVFDLFLRVALVIINCNNISKIDYVNKFFVFLHWFFVLYFTNTKHILKKNGSCKIPSTSSLKYSLSQYLSQLFQFSKEYFIVIDQSPFLKEPYLITFNTFWVSFFWKYQNDFLHFLLNLLTSLYEE